MRISRGFLLLLPIVRVRRTRFGHIAPRLLDLILGRHALARVCAELVTINELPTEVIRLCVFCKPGDFSAKEAGSLPSIMLPVTQQFSLSWKPEIRFIERRLDPLKRFEEQGRVHSFSVHQAEISVYIDSRYQEIRYGSSGLTVRIADPQADAKVAFDTASEVFQIFEPVQIGLGRANLQFLDALEGDYDELRLRWGARFVSPPQGISISDWALLINPDVLETQPQWGGAMEFGVVQGDEAKPRLAREVGKLSDEGIGEPSDRIDFPEVAFFADANFASVGAMIDGKDDLLETSLSAWITIREKISELATKIKDDFVGGDSA